MSSQSSKILPSHHQNHFIPPLWLYLSASAALFFLTAFTVITSRMHLGPWEMPVALSIASCKSLIVLLVFMGIWWEASMIPAIIFSTFVFIFIFFIVTFSDIAYRGNNSIEMSCDNIHSLRSPPPAPPSSPSLPEKQ